MGKGPANLWQRRLKGLPAVAKATPWILARGTMAAYVGSATTSNTVNLPQSPDGSPWPANTLAIVVGVSGPATFSIGAGWTTLQAPTTSSFLAYKFLNGTETTLPYSRGATFQADILHCVIIGGGLGVNFNSAPEATTATDNPAAITPSWGADANTVFLTIGTGAVAGTNITAYPGMVTDSPYSFFSNLGDSIGQTLNYTDAKIYNEQSERGVTAATYDPSTYTATNTLRTYTIAVRMIGPAVAQTLPLVAGTFNLTGTAATTKAGKILPLAAGSLALTGSAATLKWGRILTLAAGAFNLTGSAATLLRGVKLPLVAGAFSLTGSAATTRGAHFLSLAAGSFTITGSAATLLRGVRLPLVAGSYALTGSAATLKTGRVLPLAAGSFALTGSSETLLRGVRLALANGTFTLTGSAATLTFTPGAGGAINNSLALAAGSFSVTGSAATLKVGRKLVLAAGAYSLTGSAATLQWGRRLVLAAGAFNVTGSAATLIRGVRLPLVAGAYALTGSAATLKVGRILPLAAGAYALTGSAATLRWGRILALAAGAYNLTGSAATLTFTPGTGGVAYTLALASGSFNLTGRVATLTTSVVTSTGGDTGGGGKRRKKKLVIPAFEPDSGLETGAQEALFPGGAAPQAGTRSSPPPDRVPADQAGAIARELLAGLTNPAPLLPETRRSDAVLRQELIEAYGPALEAWFLQAEKEAKELLHRHVRDNHIRWREESEEHAIIAAAMEYFTNG